MILLTTRSRLDTIQIKGSQALLFTDDIADAMMYCIENDDLEPGCGVQAFATGLEIIKTETHPVKKIKDTRKREGKAKAKM